MKGSKKKTGYKMETKATDQQLKNREILYKLFQAFCIPNILFKTNLAVF